MEIRNGVVLLALSLPMFAQPYNSIYVPDSDPTAGACTALPFGSVNVGGGMTFLARVPASALDPAYPRLGIVSMATCGSGTFIASTISIQIWHLKSPLPSPVTFDTSTFWDSTCFFSSLQNGALTASFSANTWSILIAGPCGQLDFCWDGCHDIGIYVSYQSAVLTGWDGSCHGSPTSPNCFYAPGYGAQTSVGTANLGLKLKLDFVAMPPLYQLNSSGSSLTINGVQGNEVCAASTFSSPNSTLLLSLQSTNVGLPFELAIAQGGLVQGGFIVTATGQQVNLHLASWNTFWFLNGGMTPGFSVQFPGPTSLSANTGPTPWGIAYSAQQINLDPSHPDGFSLSQGCIVEVL